MDKDYTDLHRYFMQHDMDWILKFNTKIIEEAHENKKDNILKERKNSI